MTSGQMTSGQMTSGQMTSVYIRKKQSYAVTDVYLTLVLKI
jgi:hypothetical protein